MKLTHKSVREMAFWVGNVLLYSSPFLLIWRGENYSLARGIISLIGFVLVAPHLVFITRDLRRLKREGRILDKEIRDLEIRRIVQNEMIRILELVIGRLDAAKEEKTK